MLPLRFVTAKKTDIFFSRELFALRGFLAILLPSALDNVLCKP